MKKKKSLKQWLKSLETKHNKKIDLGLERVSKVYNNLNLEKIAPVIFTVAGTNGKGSTVAILSSICQQAGYKVGEFTSPHIVKYNERIKVNSQNCSNELITGAFELIDKNLQGVTLSYFEYATLAAAVIFKQQSIDIAILEVGLGGRLDSVNTIDTDCAIITTIDIDHTSWLGDNIESIAYEKAGIIRSLKPVIYGDAPCPLSIINQAKKINAQLIKVDDKENYNLNIAGEYQQKNTKTAIAAIKSMNLNISKEQIINGLINIKLSGRLQTISKNPQVIIDVSHNKQAAMELSKWLNENPTNGRTIAVFAVLEDKQPLEWLENFKDNIDFWCISTIDSERAMKANDLVKMVSLYSSLILSFPSIKEAYLTAKKLAIKKDRILVFGSFYTVSEMLK